MPISKSIDKTVLVPSQVQTTYHRVTGSLWTSSKPFGPKDTLNVEVGSWVNEASWLASEAAIATQGYAITGIQTSEQLGDMEQLLLDNIDDFSNGQKV